MALMASWLNRLAVVAAKVDWLKTQLSTFARPLPAHPRFLSVETVEQALFQAMSVLSTPAISALRAKRLLAYLRRLLAVVAAMHNMCAIS